MELTQAQKAVVIHARWLGVSPRACFNAMGRSLKLYYTVEAFYRSDECLDAVAAVVAAFGNHGS